MKKITTIQQTSKKYKAMQLAGGFSACIGVALITAHKPNPGAALLFGGFFVFFFGRFLAWWNHG